MANDEAGERRMTHLRQGYGGAGESEMASRVRRAPRVVVARVADLIDFGMSFEELKQRKSVMWG
jgi:hypothetical protein